MTACLCQRSDPVCCTVQITHHEVLLVLHFVLGRIYFHGFGMHDRAEDESPACHDALLTFQKELMKCTRSLLERTPCLIAFPSLLRRAIPFLDAQNIIFDEETTRCESRTLQRHLSRDCYAQLLDAQVIADAYSLACPTGMTGRPVARKACTLKSEVKIDRRLDAIHQYLSDTHVHAYARNAHVHTQRNACARAHTYAHALYNPGYRYRSQF